MTKRLAISLISATVLLVGGSATGVSAQEVEPEIEVTGDVDPGGEVTVDIANAEPEVPVNVTLGDQVADGVTDADGNGSVNINAPDTPGEVDGIVNINGVDVPFSVLVNALQDAGAGDDTVQPTAVNTGDELSSSSNALALFAAAAGLFLLGGGAMAFRRRSVES